MEEKEIALALEAKAKELFEGFKNETISKNDFEAKQIEIQNEIKGLKDNTFVADLSKSLEDLKEQSKNQGIAISEMRQMKSINPEPKTLLDGVKELFATEEIKSYIEEGAKGKSRTVKAAINITQATAITAGSTQPTRLLGGVPVYNPERKISMTDVISTGNTSTDTVTFNQEYDFVDGVTTLTENQASGKTSFKIRPVTANTGRIGTHLIVSKRSLKNESYLMSHIAARLPQKIKKAEDTQILFGDGTGANLTGLTENASVFAAGAFAQKIPAAQEIDALYVAISQLTQGEYQASGIVLNPISATKIELLKDSQSKYIDSLRAVRGQDGVLRVGGLPVVETTAMPADKFLVGDFRMACDFLYFTPLSMSIYDQHASIALNNEVLIVFEEEPMFPIYNPLMFVYGDFTIAKTALTPGT